MSTRGSAIKASYINNTCYAQDLIYTVTKVTSNEYIIGGRTGGGGTCPSPPSNCLAMNTCLPSAQSSTHIVSSANISDTFDVALCWDHDPIFTLNGLHHESSYMRIRAHFLSVSMCVYGYEVYRTQVKEVVVERM